MPPDRIIQAIEEVRDITEETSGFEDYIKDIAPGVSIIDVRGRPTDVDNPATFVPAVQPIASAATQLLVSLFVLACATSL